ncbi:MAG: SMP-30/gluconolactonase/LRE family protein [Ilumatobacteraceae bacterium]
MATVAVALSAAISTVGSVAADQGGKGRPATYEMTGDVGGSKFEGIGVDRAQKTFYVSEVSGGEIHRGDVRSGTTEEWMPAGADGRFTARGITTDRHDRIYIAGGPNGIGTGRPDLWVYNHDGDLLAALRVDQPDAFLNDVAIGPDGAAYFTNSNAPQIFRVALDDGGWNVTTWADATGSITQEPGFNLGGIVVSADQRALVVAQGNVGALWRFDLATGTATQIDTGDADLSNADGLVLSGHRLTVVRNFSRVITTLRLDAHSTAAQFTNEVATDPDRVFTTAKIAHGRLLVVDSKFDEQVAQPPYQVVSLHLNGQTPKP